jgi:hypothetical protein
MSIFDLLFKNKTFSQGSHLVPKNSFQMKSLFTSMTPFISQNNPNIFANTPNPFNMLLTGENMFVTQINPENINNTISILNLSDGSTIATIYAGGMFLLGNMIISNNNLYVTVFSNSYDDGLLSGDGTTILEFDSTTGILINSSWCSGLQSPFGIAVLGNFMYVTNSYYNNVNNQFEAYVSRINASNGSIDTLRLIDVRDVAFFDIKIYNNNLYINTAIPGEGFYSKIIKADLNGTIINDDWASLSASSYVGGTSMTIVGDTMYYGDLNNNLIVKIDMLTGTIVDPAFLSSINGPYGIANDGTNLYISEAFTSDILKVSLLPPPVPIYKRMSLFTDNAMVYYKPGSLAPGGVNTVRNSSIKAKRV